MALESTNRELQFEYDVKLDPYFLQDDLQLPMVLLSPGPEVSLLSP